MAGQTSSTVKGTPHKFLLPGPSQGQRSTRTRPVDVGKTGNRGSSQHLFSGLLQPTLCCPQKGQPMASSDRPVSVQHLSGHSTLQDGDARVNQGFTSARRVGGLNRPLGRLFPRPTPSPSTALLSLPGSRGSLPVQSDAVRPGHGTTGIHHSRQGVQTPSPSPGISFEHIPRRLDQQKPAIQISCSINGQAVDLRDPFGISSEFSQVESSAGPTVRLRGVPLQPSSRPSGPTTEQNRQNSSSHSTASGENASHCEIINVSDWPLSLHREDGPSREDSFETSPMAFKEPLEVPSLPRVHGASDNHVGSTPQMVEQLGQSPEGISTSPSRPRCPGLHGRVSGWVGVSLSGIDSQRSMDGPGISIPYQHSGNESCPIGNEALSAPITGQSHTDSDRQYDGRVLSQQTEELMFTLCMP